ncbi:putative protein ImpA [Pantoea sp. AS-PWVM4]|uniref:type VI secretion system protein TssA n=1 Tax=Pantoea sp. AS-PWVM4 TaxID=1332069 RepID=UPI0003AC95F8|nr:type VI secretion system protein TssA [Pantoea sp. AS-PWVM4]ERK17763.1 putative protein ImpA [Pantoea sp. AS-PWVM4]
MTIDLDALLVPISNDDPCGENLEYHADFQAMEQASAGKAEQQFGETIIPAEPADWNRVEKLATELLSRSKDLRVMLALTQAWTHLNGLPGYAQGLALIEQALLRYWDPLWPRLEEDGELDPFYRINALALLEDASSLTAAVRQAWLLRHASDGITLRDAIALCDGSKSETTDYPGGMARLRDELAQQAQPAAATVQQIDQRLQSLHHIIAERLGESAVPDMTQVQKNFAVLVSLTQSAEVAEVAPDTSDDQQTDAPAPRSVADWRTAQLTNRADAQLMLEKVKQYFAQHEPSHPAPLMIDRVQRLIELDFMDIIRDLAPDGVHQLQNIFGRHD